MNFGALVEILPGKEGMIHISKLTHERVAKVEDVVNIGDEVTVKVIEIDNMGHSTFRKDLLPAPERTKEARRLGSSVTRRDQRDRD